LVAYVAENGAQSKSARVDNNAQLVASVAENVAQSTWALIASKVTITELATTLDHNAQHVAPDQNIAQSTASLLTLAQAVRKPYVPSFFCQSLCI
jgi:hypothetical protein